MSQVTSRLVTPASGGPAAAVPPSPPPQNPASAHFRPPYLPPPSLSLSDVQECTIHGPGGTGMRGVLFKSSSDFELTLSRGRGLTPGWRRTVPGTPSNESRRGCLPVSTARRLGGGTCEGWLCRTAFVRRRQTRSPDRRHPSELERLRVPIAGGPDSESEPATNLNGSSEVSWQWRSAIALGKELSTPKSFP
jgi:hypothetical protein